MRLEGRRLRRAKCLNVYWRDSRLVFRTYAAPRSITGAPITCAVLHFFSDWRMPAEAVQHFAEYAPRSVRTTVSKLVQHGLLLREHSREAERDEYIAASWAPWLPEASFHFSTKDAEYVSAAWSDRQIRSLLPDTPPPPQFKSVRGRKQIALPQARRRGGEFRDVLLARRTYWEFGRDKLSLASLAELLSLVWGVNEQVDAGLFGRLPLKTSPSGGARHPGEVYLVARRVSGLERGVYYYHPLKHTLSRVAGRAAAEGLWKQCARQDHVRRAAALFLMTAVFPRTMWKYGKARAYRVVLLDAGHLCQTFCLTATWLGLAPFCTAAFSDSGIERVLGIDGVEESMLYVAGVGARPAEGKPTAARP